MLYFPKWLVSLILGICIIGVIVSLPNAFSAQTVERWPSFMPRKQVNLGLDLKGGSYLLYEVDMGSVLRDRLNNVVDGVRTEFRTAKIGYTGLNAGNDNVTFTLTDAARTDDARAIVKKVDPELDATVTAGGAFTLKFNEA